jgi:transcription elongation factor Elf1
MLLPQLVGLKCSACNKTIASDGTVTSEGAGEFCLYCYNPIHVACKPAAGSPIPDDRCPACGSDPQSAIALEVKAEVDEEMAKGNVQVVCPNCGSRQGFRPYEGSNPQTGPLVVLGLIPFLLIKATGNVGKLQCSKCDFIFRPPSRLREIGCIVLVICIVILFAVIAVLRT